MREKLFTLFMALLIAATGAYAQKQLSKSIDKEKTQEKAVKTVKQHKLQIAAEDQNTNKPIGKKKAQDGHKVHKKAPVYHVGMQLPTKEDILSEDFSGDGLPADWQNIDEAGTGQVWAFNNPGGQEINTTTAENGFAILDSDHYGSGSSQDAYLVTPALDLSANTSVKVMFEHYYNDYQEETAEFMYSLDSGATWNVVHDFSGTDTENASVFSQVVDGVAGEDNVMFAWHYAGSWGWYWAVDDITIYEPDPYAFAVNYPEGTMVSVGTSIDYMVEVSNMGANNDVLDITAAGNSTWTTEVLDIEGNALTSVSVDVDSTEAFIVRVHVPDTAESETTDTESFTITSQNDAAITESFDITTTALGPVMAPYAQSFEGDYFPPAGWTVINNDGGEKTWEQYDEPHTGDFSAAVGYESPNDDWLISSKLIVSEGELLKFYAKAGSSFFTEDFNVLVSNTTSAMEDFTLIDSVREHPNEWVEHAYILTDYADITAGDTIHLAIQCVSDYELRLLIDDFIMPGPNEAGIASIDKPTAPVIIGNRPVKATVTNGGTADLTSATIMWEVNGTQNQLDWTGTIAPGASDMITLGNADFQGDSLNKISAWITSRNGETEDAIAANDSIHAEMLGIDAGQMWETFDGEFVPNGWSVSTPAGDFSWEQFNDDWAGNGFVMDGNYAGLLSNANGAIDTLFTPKLEIDTSYTNELAFDVGGLQNAAGDGGATIHVLASTDMATWEEVHTVDLTADEAIRTEIVTLDTLHGQDYYFAFAVTNTYNNADYITVLGIDNVKGPEIAGLANNDLKVVDIYYPQEFVQEGETATVKVEVQNVGLDDQEHNHVHLAVDGGTPMVDSIGSLAYSKIQMVEFEWTAVAGRHEFMANVMNDDNDSNDTAMIDAVAIADGMLAEGFETLDADDQPVFPPYGWEGDAEGNWQPWNAGFTPIYEGDFAAAVGNEAGFENVILSTRKVELTGADEELNFYMNAGNLTVGPTDVDIVYSQDKENWTVLEDSIVPTAENELYTVDLSSITAGDYYLGFRATGTGDGTYSTWTVIDHVVGPNNVPLFDLTYNVTDTVGNVVGDAAIEMTDDVMTWEATTDSLGQAMFMAIEAGDYDYTVNAYSFQEKIDSLTIVDTSVTEHVEMVPEPLHDVTFNVEENWGSNEAVEGAVVSFTDGTSTWTDTTDVIGTVTFNDIFKQNDYAATIEADSYIMAVDTFDVDDADVTLDIMLDELIETPTDLNVNVDGSNATLGWNGAGGGSGGPSGAILVVDHDVSNAVDGFTDDWTYIQPVLDALGVDYTYVESDATSYNGPDLATMQEHDIIIWFTGEGWQNNQTMTATDEANLADFIDGGGKLFLSAQDYIWDVYSNSDTYTFSAGEFPYDYLGVETVTQDAWWSGSGGEHLAHEGADGSLAEGYSFYVDDIYTTKDGITTDMITAHTGTDMLSITDAPAGLVAIQTDNVVFWPGSVAAVTDEQVRTDLISDIISYLGNKDNKESKALQSYSVYLNDAEMATGTTDSTYTFTGIDIGTHTAGVKAVYETGESDTATIDFDVMSSVTFTVVDEDNNAMEGVTVTVGGEDHSTDANGEAHMMMAAGEHDYTVTHTGYDEVTGTLNVTTLTTTKTIVMSETEYAVTFNVTDGTDPLEGAEIIVDGNMLVTDASGVATIGLVDGNYDYDVTKEGYDDVSATLDVAGSVVSEDVEMQETVYTITFEVSDGTDPLAGVSITIDDSTIETDSLGQATIDLPDGEYTYNATLDNYGDASGSITVDGEPMTENIDMTGIGNLANAEFSLYPNPTQGKFTITLDGRYDVTVTNSIGQVVYQNTINQTDEIDLGNLSSGLYQVTIQSDDKYGTHSIVIE